MNVDDLPKFREYLRVVADAWDQRRGYELPEISNPEWLLIRWWFTRSIPLRVVLRALQDIPRHLKPETMMYLQKPVESAYEHWRQAMGGAA